MWNMCSNLSVLAYFLIVTFYLYIKNLKHIYYAVLLKALHERRAYESEDDGSLS